jgi:predicted phage baseplate assembly protein
VLPQIVLDDLKFQELVSEARTRIVRHSPDWTEHNVSDPGITLIELFAWLIEILVYRIDRVPDRLHVALLELIGISPAQAEVASVDVRFELRSPGEELTLPAGTEVSSPRTIGDDAVIFQTAAELVIPSRQLAGYVIERSGEVKSVAVTGGRAEPAGGTALPFASPPAPGDALMLGFEEPISGLVIRIDFESSQAKGAGLDKDDPPLLWEASGEDGDWHLATIVDDETGGFLNGDGAVTIEVPAGTGIAGISGKKLHWLRCRVTERTQSGVRAAFARPPEIGGVSAAVAGATVRAVHSGTINGEILGTSEGVSGPAYPLQHHPVLDLREGETLEVREPDSDQWVEWRAVDSFSLSGSTDRHFMLDKARGEVRFGPSVRQPEGGWRQYGAVPAGGAWLRFTRYRYGGGRAGNVAPGAIKLLGTPNPAVLRVTNPRHARGGLDAEPLDGARARAALEVRSRTRAVTGEDYERLALEASPDVARALCVASNDFYSPTRLHVLPRVANPDRELTIQELTPSESLLAGLAEKLEERRLIGTSLQLVPVRFKGVTVVADVHASSLADLERVQHDVEHALYVFLNPIIGGSPDGRGDGWPRGRVLNQGELFGIVYGISGVEFVNFLRMYETDIRTGEQAVEPTESHLPLDPDQLIVSGKHLVKASHRE